MIRNALYLSILLMLLMLACQKKIQEDGRLEWQNVQVRSISEVKENKYHRVMLGIYAQPFYLFTADRNYPDILKKLQNSLLEGQPVAVRVQKGIGWDNRIIHVK